MKKIDVNLLKINKLVNNLILKSIIIFIFSISVSLLSVYLMIGIVTEKFKYITLVVTFLYSFIYLYKNYNIIVEKLKLNKKSCIIGLILSLIIFYELIIMPNIGVVINRLFDIKTFFYLSFLGLDLIVTITFVKIKDWVIEFIETMDDFEKKAYIFTSITMFVLVLITYLKTDYFYIQYDKVYSLDSGWVYDRIFADPYYYDIRHPLMSILTFPIYALIDFIFSSNLKPFILQFFNVQLLIFVGLQLKRMTKNSFVYIFYILSFSSVLFSLFFEKYILCIFLMVTYLYNVFIRKKSNNELLVFIVGAMPTNIFIIAVELFRNSKFKKKIKNIFRIGVVLILMFISLGRIHCLFNGYEEMIKAKDRFGKNTFTITEKINSTTKMIEHSFIALNSHRQSDIYKWNDVTNGVSYVGVAIIIIVLLGFRDIYKTKDKIYFSFLLSFAFSIVLFMILNWSVHESPLFSICFSWAIIPLFIFGLEKMFSLLKINQRNYKYIYCVMIMIMVIINSNGIIDIYKFMLS